MALRKVQRYAITVIVIAVVISGCLLFIHDRNGGTLDLSDTEVRIVISGSMDGEPRDQYDISTIPIESMVFIHRVPSEDAGAFYSSLQAGDVLTFHYRHPVSHEDMVVTHRIIDISESAGVYTYTCKGDSIADDPTNGSVQIVTSSSGDVIGKVVGVSPTLGSLVVFLSTATGKLCLIIVPCIAIIASEIKNIFGIVRGHGKDDAEEETGKPVQTDVEFVHAATPMPVKDDGMFIRRS